MSRIKIIGTGSYLPEKILTNLDLEKIVDTTDEWISTRTGIKERRITDENTAVSDLMTEASKKAIEMANIPLSEIDGIIAGTITPDMMFPATACIIQKNLGIKNKFAFDLSAGCSGFIYALEVANNFIKSGNYKNLLVIGGETLTKITNWSDRNTCVLFGDGAGAVVVTESTDDSGVLSSMIGAAGEYGDLLYQPAGGSRMPASKETIEKNLHTVVMQGSEVFQHAVRSMQSAGEEVIKAAGITSDDIDIFIPHQANIRILQSTAKRLKIPIEKVYINIDKYANTSAGTLPIALDQAVRSNEIKKGDIILFDVFGAGLTWGAAIVRW